MTKPFANTKIRSKHDRASRQEHCGPSQPPAVVGQTKRQQRRGMGKAYGGDGRKITAFPMRCTGCSHDPSGAGKSSRR